MTETRERPETGVATSHDPSSSSVTVRDQDPIRLELEDFLPYQLNLLAAEVSQSLARIYGERFDISIPEWRVLATLGQFGSTTAREISEHSRMHKTTVSRALAALEKRRLVTRRTNRQDMREAFVTLSETGRATYLDIVPLARNFAGTLCADLSHEEQVVLHGLITRLTRTVLGLQDAGGTPGRDHSNRHREGM